MNVLLDDFEEKAGAARLTQEYAARRRELDDRLSKPVPVKAIDDSISGLRKDIAAVEGKIEAERARLSSKISELKAEQSRCEAELEEERKRAAAAATEQGNGSFFSRHFGRGRAPVKEAERQVGELEAKLKVLPDEVEEQRKQLKAVDLRSSGAPYVEEWGQLETMRTQLKGLEEERLDMTQLVKERAEAAGSLAGAISAIQ